MTVSALLNGLVLAGVAGMAALAEPAPEPVAARPTCFVMPDVESMAMGPHGPYIALPFVFLPCSETQLAWAWRST